MKKDTLPADAVTLRPLVSVEQSAEIWGVRPSYVYAQIYGGKIKFVRVGRHIRLNPDTVLQIYQAEQRHAPRPARKTVPADKALKFVREALERLGQMSYADLGVRTRLSNWSLSQAVARLLSEGKITRTGGGRKSDPYLYRLSGER